MANQTKGPSHRLVITDRDNKRRKTYAGAAFKTEFGFSIVLNPGVILSEEQQDRFYFNLYPLDRDKSGPPNGDPNDDIPFG